MTILGFSFPIIASGLSGLAQMAENLAGGLVAFVERVSAFFDYYDACEEKWRSRRELLELDEHILKDIGISRAQAEEEAAKPFFDESLK